MPASAGLSVVITGASSGIGEATALAFARAGARLTHSAPPRSPRPPLGPQSELAGGGGQ